MTDRTGLSRGDRNRNARLARLREAVPLCNAGWAIGEYAIFGSGENEGKQIAGKYGETLVHDSDGWHIAMLVGNSPPPKP